MHPPRDPHRSVVRSCILAFLLTPVGLCAQVDSISANPKAVMLRHVWSRSGTGGVGNVVAGLWDVTGDGRDEFGVEDLGDHQWRIYSLDSLGQSRVVWQRRGESPQPIAGGRLRGPGGMMLVYPREIDSTSPRQYHYDFFDADSGRIAETPRLTWSSVMGSTYLVNTRFLVVDLDLDGADEFIVVAPVANRNGESIRNGEIWIYRGGPGFQIDSPAVVIRDSVYNGGGFALHVGRVDSDVFPDLVCITRVGGRIRWGGADLATLDRPFDRWFGTVNRFLDLLDADGDGLSDFLWLGAYLHLSSSGKDPRTRDFDGNDADRHFVGRGPTTFVLGPLNDSAGRYDMFGLPTSMGDNVALMFSGAHEGPDSRYDAYYSTALDGLGAGWPFVVGMPAGDVDGNGWRDYIAGNERFGGGGGIAIVLGGGAYIPRDSMPASAIRDIALDGRRAAISVWPNPADDVVHIAWRGDLHRTPARFMVHDLLGRLVARGETDGMHGEVLWRCGDRPPGIYLLTVSDAGGEVIVSALISKR